MLLKSLTCWVNDGNETDLTFNMNDYIDFMFAVTAFYCIL